MAKSVDVPAYKYGLNLDVFANKHYPHSQAILFFSLRSV